jgi:branched-subunit amino acid transport protein AzlD
MVNMQKTFLFAKTFSNFFNKIGRQYPYGVLAVLKKNCLTDYSLLTIHTGIASTACVMTQGVIASTACVYTQEEIASTAYGRP